jgi:hypothetical protein
MLKLVESFQLEARDPLEPFDHFWRAYPRKVARKDAKKAFEQLNPSPELLREILEAIERHKLSDQWQELKYIPYPATYIRGERWYDELETNEEKPWWMQ